MIQPISILTYLQAAEAASEDPEPTPTEGVQGFNGDLRPAGALDESNEHMKIGSTAKTNEIVNKLTNNDDFRIGFFQMSWRAFPQSITSKLRILGWGVEH